MPARIYIAKLAGNGQTELTAYRPVWRDVLGWTGVQSHGVIESIKYQFWIGEIVTDDTQHATLVAHADIRWIDHAALDVQWSALTQAQRDKAAEIVTWLGFEPRDVTQVFASTGKVRDLLFWLLGKAAWRGLRSFEEA